MLEYKNSQVAIHPTRLSELITALRTAVENGEGMLDKEATCNSVDMLTDSIYGSVTKIEGVESGITTVLLTSV
jgi:hypothetical protein